MVGCLIHSYYCYLHSKAIHIDKNTFNEFECADGWMNRRDSFECVLSTAYLSCSHFNSFLKLQNNEREKSRFFRLLEWNWKVFSKHTYVYVCNAKQSKYAILKVDSALCFISHTQNKYICNGTQFRSFSSSLLICCVRSFARSFVRSINK